MTTVTARIAALCSFTPLPLGNLTLCFTWYQLEHLFYQGCRLRPPPSSSWGWTITTHAWCSGVTSRRQRGLSHQPQELRWQCWWELSPRQKASLRRNSVFPSWPFPDAKPKAALDPPPGVRALHHCRPGRFNTDYLLHTHAAVLLC